MVRTETAGRIASTPKGAKRARRSIFSRLSFGHVVMISAGLLAFLLNMLVLRSKGETMEVPVAAQPITAGTRLRAEDVGYRSVDAEGPFLDRVLHREAVASLLGHVVIRDIDPGAPLLTDDLKPAAAPDAGRAMNIPVTPDHAVGAALSVGDRVDVIAVDDGGSRFVATGIKVLGVALGGGRTSGDRFGVTVAVSEEEALAIAVAIDGDAVHLVRSTGSSEIGAAPVPVAPRAPGRESRS
ncbi:MAG: SAF domain-containing protein [bacterium]|nr:SAF domain-containing protein [bacterium]